MLGKGLNLTRSTIRGPVRVKWSKRTKCHILTILVQNVVLTSKRGSNVYLP